MLETILIALAALGVLGIIVGRHIMIRDTGGELSMLWILALRMLPFSELIYMVRHYTQARTGGLIAIAGMWLIVPYAGTQLWERQKIVQEQVGKWEQEFSEQLEKAEDDELEAGELSQMSAESASAFVNARERRLVEKEKLVSQLNARLAWWHEQLQQRRVSLPPGDEAAVKEFNAEASAYASLNSVAKEAAAELLALRSVARR